MRDKRGRRGMKRPLVFLAITSLGSVLMMGLVYASINPGGATATPTVFAGGSPGSWTVRSPLPTDAFGVAVASDGAYAYAFGGYSFSAPGAINQVYHYDPVADTWVSLASIPAVTYNAVAVYGNNGNIYVFG